MEAGIGRNFQEAQQILRGAEVDASRRGCREMVIAVVGVRVQRRPGFRGTILMVVFYHCEFAVNKASHSLVRKTFLF